MPDHLNLPTTVNEFIRFLNGASVEPYGNKSTFVLGALQSSIQQALVDGLESTLRQGRPGSAFHLLLIFRLNVTRILHDRLGPNDANVYVITDTCFRWVESF